jgi:hypothetical protein
MQKSGNWLAARGRTPKNERPVTRGTAPEEAAIRRPVGRYGCRMKKPPAVQRDKERKCRENTCPARFFSSRGVPAPSSLRRIRLKSGTPEYETGGLGLASDTEAYGGHLQKARALTNRAVDSAVRADNKEAGAMWQAISAQREAAGWDGCESALLEIAKPVIRGGLEGWSFDDSGGHEIENAEAKIVARIE